MLHNPGYLKKINNQNSIYVCIYIDPPFAGHNGSRAGPMIVNCLSKSSIVWDTREPT